MSNNIFICGCGHSGTTLLWAMLSAYSRVYGIPYETYAFLNKENRNKKALSPVRGAIVNGYFSIFGKPVKDEFAYYRKSGFLSYTRTDKNILEFFGKQHKQAIKLGKDIVCEKTPRHILIIDHIKRLFPQSHIVIIVRNGLDVVASIKAKPKSFDLGLRRWIEAGATLLECRKKYPLHWLRYEDLISNPELTLKDICRFCELDYEDSILSYYKSSSVPGWHGKNRAELLHQPLMDRRGRWKEILTDEEIAMIKNHAGDLMKYFNYEFN